MTTPQVTSPHPGAVQTVPKNNEVQYVPFGGEDSIKLSVQIIRDFVAIPTKTGKLPENPECIRFMMLCRSRKLNPFEGDCFLMGYEERNSNFVNWSLITAHQAFLKRAEVNPEFDGMDSGVIVLDESDAMVFREGDFLHEGDQLQGGWATVFFKKRTHPMKRRLNLRTFRKPYGRWNDDPAGMIVKCAEADALRSAFPTMLGGLYTDVERGPVIDIGGTAKAPDFGPEPGREPKPKEAKLAVMPAPQPQEPAEGAGGSQRKAEPAKASGVDSGEPLQPANEATDAAENAPEDFKGKIGETDSCRSLRFQMEKAGITEKQVMAYSLANGITDDPKKKMGDLSEAKHKILNKSFPNILPQLRQLAA